MKIVSVSRSTGKERLAPLDLLTTALEYAQRGWSIIPTIGKKSAHHWKQFQSKPADEPTIRRMFGRKGITGIAVILGSSSCGLACRDFDDAKAFHRWVADYPDLAKVLPTVQTARGYHVYFRGPEGFHDFDDGEYRADAGHYCVLPPSRHPDGMLYQWLIPLPDDELPFLDPVQEGLLSHPRRTQAETQAHSPYSLHVSDDGVESALSATIPSGPGERNYRLFELARRLKSIMPDATMDALNPIVCAWHTRALPVIATKEWLTSWVDFRIAWANVKRLAGATMAEIVATAKAQTPADADASVQLTVLCRTLQAYHGPGIAFPLSCRIAGQAIGVSHETAARLLKMLTIEGTIELVAPGGDKASKRAAEYRFCKVER